MRKSSHVCSQSGTRNTDNCSVQLSSEVIDNMAVATGEVLMRDNWIQPAVLADVEAMIDGKMTTIKANVHYATKAFNALYAFTYEEMQLSVPMICKPLKFAPAPWEFTQDGKVVGIHPEANMPFNKGKSVPSQRTLDIINKDMSQPLRAHHAMIKLARIAISNPQVFRELDRC